jgi:hypothetical protein
MEQLKKNIATINVANGWNIEWNVLVQGYNSGSGALIIIRLEIGVLKVVQSHFESSLCGAQTFR